MSEHWILCVDDEEKVLEGLELQLGFDYEVRTANGGKAGLELLEAHPDCAVIISDMRMPEMNGAQFLTEAKARYPDTTRMLLTGYSDVEAAIAAINEGGIFRFLAKPTSPDLLMSSVEEGVRHWELIQSEKVLLEQTLHGAAQALVEALEIASPAAFSRSRRVESACRHVATELGMPDVWEVALAGLLLRLGWIAVPSDIVDAHLGGGELSDADAAMFDDAHATTLRLIGKIPRLDGVARIITEARNPSWAVDAATVVATVGEFDRRLLAGEGASKALKDLDNSCPRDILVALSSWPGSNDDAVVKTVEVWEVVEGMHAEKDIVTLTGNILVRAGTEITETVVQRLRNFANSQGVEQPITVSVKA